MFNCCDSFPGGHANLSSDNTACLTDCPLTCHPKWRTGDMEKGEEAGGGWEQVWKLCGVQPGCLNPPPKGLPHHLAGVPLSFLLSLAPTAAAASQGWGHISRTHSVASSILFVQELYTVGTYLRALALPSHRPSQHVAKVTLVPREKKRLEIMTLAKATYAAILTIHITNPPEIIINWEWSPTFRQIEQLEWHEHKTQRASSFGCCKLLQIPFPQNVPKDTPKECRELSREIAAAFWKWFGLQILMFLEAGSLCDALR